MNRHKDKERENDNSFPPLPPKPPIPKSNQAEKSELSNKFHSSFAQHNLIPMTVDSENFVENQGRLSHKDRLIKET
ncbi:hypothetical protein LguiA_035008 [Lonicera macranthoides]